MKPHNIALFWFRRVLRLDDNRSLLEAVKTARSIVPVFILDPAILSHPTTGAARTNFLFESLTDLDESLRERGNRLIIRYGQPVEELSRLIRESGATALYFSRDYEPYARNRDQSAIEVFQKQGIHVEAHSDLLLTEPGEILTQSGKPYTVFTPYRRVWNEFAMLPPQNGPAHISGVAHLASEPLPDIEQYSVGGGTVKQKPRVSGGAREAGRLLEAFVDNKVETYDSQRDRPSAEGTSRLSAALKMGVLSPRRLLAAVQEKRTLLRANKMDTKGAETFLSELAWRDFYYQILYHFPSVAEGAFRPEYNAIRWENNETLFESWCQGRTGYPIVDAAQRQLNTEAWMHNRARMITASFLTKDLLCNWQWGERYFMQNLIDGDLAANNGGWQWAASTGTDAQPFFRIFNPVTQGEKFDPDGEYVRRYVPELRHVPVRYIHRPWELSPAEQEAVGCVLGRDYPYPVVDHKMQRQKALALYRRDAEGDTGAAATDTV